MECCGVVEMRQEKLNAVEKQNKVFIAASFWNRGGYRKQILARKTFLSSRRIISESKLEPNLHEVVTSKNCPLASRGIQMSMLTAVAGSSSFQKCKAHSGRL